MTQTSFEQMIGATAYDADGDKVGKVGQVFLDDTSGQPLFLTVNTGMFGTHESFVPVSGATFDGDSVRLPFDKATIKDAPTMDVDGGHLDPTEESTLFSYYGVAGSGTNVAPTTGTENYATGQDTSGVNTDEAMTRSEEHLEVGTGTVEAGRARLRKYVTTEQETVTVPVRKERAVLETEPITSANAGDALDGPAISEEEHEVVLTEERAVVQTVATPVERVRLGTETVVEDETVTGDVRSEHVEVEGDVDPR